MVPRYFANPWLAGGHILPPLGVFDYELAQRAALVYTLDASEEGFPAGSRYLASSKVSFTARDLFLSAGLLQSPATGPGDRRCWAFMLEHAESFRESSGHLRVIGSDTWNSRMRAAFGERIAMGIAGLLLWRCYGVVHIADAGYFIGRTIQDPHSPYNGTTLDSLGLYGKTGELEPDFFCLTAQGEAVIAESKGAFGAPSAVSDDKNHGKEQVKNVKAGGIPERAKANRLVFALSMRRDDERPNRGKDSQVVIVDPPANEGAMEVAMTQDELILRSYAKALRFGGAYLLADAFALGQLPRVSENVLRELTIELQGYRVFPIIRINNFVFGFVDTVARSLFVRGSDTTPDNLQEVLRGSLVELGVLLAERGLAAEGPLILPNGVVVAFEG